MFQVRLQHEHQPNQFGDATSSINARASVLITTTATAGHKIGGLEDYAVILRALKPDQPAEIVILRENKELRLTITPTLRKSGP